MVSGWLVARSERVRSDFRDDRRPIYRISLRSDL